PLRPVRGLVFSCRAAPATSIYALSLHDALPILLYTTIGEGFEFIPQAFAFFVLLFLGLYLYSRKYRSAGANTMVGIAGLFCFARSEEHTSELQSRENLVCRPLLEQKKTRNESRR